MAIEKQQAVLNCETVGNRNLGRRWSSEVEWSSKDGLLEEQIFK